MIKNKRNLHLIVNKKDLFFHLGQTTVCAIVCILACLNFLKIKTKFYDGKKRAYLHTTTGHTAFSEYSANLLLSRKKALTSATYIF